MHCINKISVLFFLFFLSYIVKVKTNQTESISLLETYEKNNTDIIRKIKSKNLVKGIDLYEKPVNPYKYEYTINPGETLCGEEKGKNVFLLIVVNSSPHKFEFRNSLRNTWAKRSIFPDTRVLFLMGETSNQTINNRILLESNIYKDILQGSIQQ